MKRKSQPDDPFSQFTPAMFHILLVLTAHECHGYGIMQEVAAQTDGGMRLGPGTLYRSIKQLVSAGLIAESEERPDPVLDDERRRYYRITERGQQAARHEAQRLEQVVRIARTRRLLQGEGRTVPIRTE